MAAATRLRATAAASFDPVAAANFSHPTGDVMARMAASLLTDFPLVGQLNLLTTGSFDSPQQLASAGTLARGVAQMSIGSSVAATATGRCRAP